MAGFEVSSRSPIPHHLWVRSRASWAARQARMVVSRRPRTDGGGIAEKSKDAVAEKLA
jgi:hypothetical protein